MHLEINSLEKLDPDRIAGVKSCTTLSLSESSTDKIPDWICHLPLLKSLTVTGTSIYQFPDDFTNLSDTLVELVFTHNLLQSIPPIISNFSRLVTCDFSNNDIVEIPDQIGGCTALQTLSINDNKDLNKISAKIGNLVNLKNFLANRCSLSQLPIDMKNNISLTYLGLTSNKFATLPPCIMYMSSLEDLYLSNNLLPDVEIQLIKQVFGSTIRHDLP